MFQCLLNTYLRKQITNLRIERLTLIMLLPDNHSKSTYRVMVHPKNKLSIGYNKVLVRLAGILDHSCYSEHITSLARENGQFLNQKL